MSIADFINYIRLALEFIFPNWVVAVLFVAVIYGGSVIIYGLLTALGVWDG